LRESADRLCKTISYQFTNRELLETALTHRSAGAHNNERQEFLGDAILGFVIADELWQQFPEADEGQLSRLRAKLVKRETLADVARELDLGRYLLMGPGELRSGGQSRDSTQADALEALLAAVYLDGGYEAARELILLLFGKRVCSLTPDAQQKDPKTRLQEYQQAKGLSLPIYEITNVTGDPHDQTFSVRCSIPGSETESTGVGGSRRKAEQAAAAQLLATLNG
jgi:ribonuclease-3